MKSPRSGLIAGLAGSKVKYCKVADSEDGYIDLQFKRSPPKVPYKAIALATFLFVVGSLLIIIGALLLTGYIEVTKFPKQLHLLHLGEKFYFSNTAVNYRSFKHPDRTIPVLIIGVLVFLPGFYHLRIAYYASKGYRGYSYEDIPDFDN